ncbi:hypothetical protein IE53DRAFT_383878 [Violaceomyces palustris]|uniref:Uncharacterized protein n=1 Tax=Violaceomyces palustris TaxID=1673888 RepID=A0ACD0P6G0_9BASI|nr:hypothetical protein IE53DRAFT_383878 [Violaceomyces palustris]
MDTAPSPSPLPEYYHLDRLGPSPLRWYPLVGRPQTYARRLGLVESFFHQMATQHHGRTDIWFRLPLTFPRRFHSQIQRRIPIVWSILSKLHPLLTCHVEQLVVPDLEGQSTKPGEEEERTAEPHFVFQPCLSSPLELYRRSKQGVTFLPFDLPTEEERSGPSEVDPVQEWLKLNLWNGSREFLDSGRPFGLSRLLVLQDRNLGQLEDGSVGDDGGDVRMELILCLSHSIADALSAADLAGQLLRYLADPRIPFLNEDGTESPPGPEVLNLLSHQPRQDPKLEQQQPPPELDDDALSSLPPALESTFPPLPSPLPPNLEVLTTTTSSKRPTARSRWFWATRRVLNQVKGNLSTNRRLTEFKGKLENPGRATPWWGCSTEWSIVRLDPNLTGSILKAAKSKGVRIGALLYAVAGTAASNRSIVTANTTEADQDPVSRPDWTVVGFPLSLRRYLSESTEGKGSVEGSKVGWSSTLALRLGFSGVRFPCHPLPLPHPERGELDQAERDLIRTSIWTRARESQRQLDRLLSSPEELFAASYLSAFDRAEKFKRGLDAWANLEEGEEGGDDPDLIEKERKGTVSDPSLGDEERQGEGGTKNMQGPGSTLNFSMVGNLDSTIPNQIRLPESLFQSREDHPPPSPAKIEVGDRLSLGVRCRTGEIFGEAYTFRSSLTLSLGHDRSVWDTREIRDYLLEMKRILQCLV